MSDNTKPFEQAKIQEETERAEAERQKNELLAAKLREFGINPVQLLQSEKNFASASG